MTRPTLGALLCAGLVACSAQPVRLDPFGRPYDTANALPPQRLADCTPRDADQAPQLLSGTRPLYPVGEQIKGRIAVVRVRFTVSEDGRVSTQTLPEGAAPQWFLNHAVIAMRDWKVEPAVKGGAPVQSVCTLLFTYDLR